MCGDITCSQLAMRYFCPGHYFTSELVLYTCGHLWTYTNLCQVWPVQMEHGVGFCVDTSYILFQPYNVDISLICYTFILRPKL